MAPKKTQKSSEYFTVIKLLSFSGLSPCLLDGAKMLSGVGEVGPSRENTQKQVGSLFGPRCVETRSADRTMPSLSPSNAISEGLVSSSDHTLPGLSHRNTGGKGPREVCGPTEVAAFGVCVLQTSLDLHQHCLHVD